MSENIFKFPNGECYKVIVKTSFFGNFTMIVDDEEGGIIENLEELVEGFSEILDTIDYLLVINDEGNKVLLKKEILEQSVLIFKKVD
jgi:hypothetical protein